MIDKHAMMAPLSGYQWVSFEGRLPTARLPSNIANPYRMISHRINGHSSLQSKWNASLDRQIHQRAIKARLWRCLSGRRYVAVGPQDVQILASNIRVKA